MKTTAGEDRSIRPSRWKIRLIFIAGVVVMLVAGWVAWDGANYPLPGEDWLRSQYRGEGWKSDAAAWILRRQFDLQQKKRFRISRKLLRELSFENTSWRFDHIGENKEFSVDFKRDSALIAKAVSKRIDKIDWEKLPRTESPYTFHENKWLIFSMPEGTQVKLELMQVMTCEDGVGILALDANRPNYWQEGMFVLTRSALEGENLSEVNTFPDNFVIWQIDLYQNSLPTQYPF